MSWSQMEAERAFKQARRRSRTRRLPVHDGPKLPSSSRSDVTEIPLDAITGTVEPNRAREFDPDFRPVARARRRWLRVWLGEHTGAGLPPIDVVRIGDAFAVRDGHHRVSVAHARGAATIDAIVA